MLTLFLAPKSRSGGGGSTQRKYLLGDEFPAADISVGGTINPGITDRPAFRRVMERDGAR